MSDRRALGPTLWGPFESMAVAPTGSLGGGSTGTLESEAWQEGLASAQQTKRAPPIPIHSADERFHSTKPARNMAAWYQQGGCLEDLKFLLPIGVFMALTLQGRW